MNNVLMKTFNHRIVAIDQKLKDLEKHRGPLTGYASIAQWHAKATHIRSLLTRLRTFALDMQFYETVAPTLYELQERLNTLPHVPPITCLERAKNILQLQPRILLMWDNSEQEQEIPEIGHVTVAACDEKILFDQDFVPPTSPDSPGSSIIHLSRHKSQGAATLPVTDVWDKLTRAVSGSYILAYDLALAQRQLEVAAERWHLPTPVLIGESFLDLYFKYLGPVAIKPGSDPEDSEMASEVIFEHLGSPFSNDASQMGAVQAARMARTLRAIAQGTLSIPGQPNYS